MEVEAGGRDFRWVEVRPGDDTEEAEFVGDVVKGSMRGGKLSSKDIEGVTESSRCSEGVVSAMRSGVDPFSREEGVGLPCCAVLEISPSPRAPPPSLHDWSFSSTSRLMRSVATSALFRLQGPSRGSHDTGGCL